MSSEREDELRARIVELEARLASRHALARTARRPAWLVAVPVLVVFAASFAHSFFEARRFVERSRPALADLEQHAAECDARRVAIESRAAACAKMTREVAR